MFANPKPTDNNLILWLIKAGACSTGIDWLRTQPQITTMADLVDKLSEPIHSDLHPHPNCLSWLAWLLDMLTMTEYPHCAMRHGLSPITVCANFMKMSAALELSGVRYTYDLSTPEQLRQINTAGFRLNPESQYNRAFYSYFDELIAEFRREEFLALYLGVHEKLHR